MALNAEDISKLTLADLERIADRFGNAVAQIREAQAALSTLGTGPQRLVLPDDGFLVSSSEEVTPVDSPAAAHRKRQFQAVEQGQPRSLRVNDPLRTGPTAAEMAERDRLMGRGRAVDPNLPDDIAAMERDA